MAHLESARMIVFFEILAEFVKYVFVKGEAGWQLKKDGPGFFLKCTGGTEEFF